MNSLDMPNANAAPSESYGSPPIRRNKLGIFVAAFTSCLSVALLGIGALFVVRVISGVTPDGAFAKGNFLEGVGFAILLASLNFVLFFITIPTAFIGLGLTLGRKPYATHSRPSDYYREGAIVGAVIVSATTGLFGLSISLTGAIGAASTGMLIGALAGLVSAHIYRLIVKPEEQAMQHDFSIFE